MGWRSGWNFRLSARGREPIAGPFARENPVNPSASEFLADVESRLSRRNISYRRDADRIVVPAAGESGFDVELLWHGGEWSVHGAGWHEHCEHAGEAMEYFAIILSDSARLRVESRGGFDYRWTLERRDAESWTELSTIGLLLFPFWRCRTTRYLQNAWWSTAEA